MTTEQFLQGIEAIAATKPKYRLGYSGEGGYCDCIGLVMGALKKGGVSWTAATRKGAIHGSNWAARFALAEGLPVPFTSSADLSVGDLVFKRRKPSQAGYALPRRYRTGGVYDCGDESDYMHVGVVTSIVPLTITHCTSGGIKRDKSIGAWCVRGRLRALAAEEPSYQPKTLRKGDRGEMVHRLQELLNERGAALAADGIFGSKTEAAVRAFQAANALSVDGVAGRKTFAALGVMG